MLTVIIGQTGIGKTSFATRLAKQTSAIHISAGSWIREFTGCWEHTKESAELLAIKSKRLLKVNPMIASQYLFKLMNNHLDKDIIIEGIRNPCDLLALLRENDKVIDLGGYGLNSWEKTGLAACRSLKDWLTDSGITWINQERYFINLPFNLALQIDESYLSGITQQETKYHLGTIVALECYPGENITALFRSEQNGGTFHDLPLEAFTFDYTKIVPSTITRCYSKAPLFGGNPVFELTPSVDRNCLFFDKDDRRYLGRGESLGILHWPSDNLLLHLIKFEKSLYLWPPHKLLFIDDETIRTLPNWSKRRV